MAKLLKNSAVRDFENNVFKNEANILLLVLFSHFKIIILKIYLSF